MTLLEMLPVKNCLLATVGYNDHSGLHGGTKVVSKPGSQSRL